ncbi:MAG: Uma2 family endonuclease [Longimonas sp.]
MDTPSVSQQRTTQTPPVSAYEQERGKPMPSKLHSITQKKLILALHKFEPPYTVFSELTVELSERYFTPDISVYEERAIDYTFDEVRMTEPPLLTVEIASPTQGVQPLIDTVRFLLGEGVQSCWLVQPQLRTITIYHGDMQHTTYADGSVTDPNLEITIDLADVFAVA